MALGSNEVGVSKEVQVAIGVQPTQTLVEGECDSLACQMHHAYRRGACAVLVGTDS